GVRDGSPVRAFATRPFDIDVEPLVVAGASSELIDAFLIDRDPFGNTQLAAHERRAVFEAECWMGQRSHIRPAGQGLRLAGDASRRSRQQCSGPRNSPGIARARASLRACRRSSWLAPTPTPIDPGGR